MSQDETPKSPFAAAIEARFAKRQEHEFDVDGYFGLGDKPIPKVAMRVPTAMEQVWAIDEAHRLLKVIAREPETRSDPDVLSDLKLCCLAFWAARAVGSTSKHSYPAFPSAEWMVKHMTNDQIGAIVQLGATVKRRESPTPVERNDDAVEALATALSVSAGTAQADVILAGIVDREALNDFLIAISDKLMTARADLAAYVKEQALKETIAADAIAATPEPDAT